MPVFPGESCYLQIAVCIFASQSELHHLQCMVSVCVCVHMIYRVNCSILERWGNPVCYFEIRQPASHRQPKNPPASQPQTAEKSTSQHATNRRNPPASQPRSVAQNPPASQPQTAEESASHPPHTAEKSASQPAPDRRSPQSASQSATDSRKIRQPASHRQAESASQPAAVRSPKSASQPAATDSGKIRQPASPRQA